MMSESVKVYAVLSAREGRTDELEALLRGMVAPSRSEEGNLRYDLWRDLIDTGRFVLEELYRDQAAAAAHKESAHFQHYLSRVNDLATRIAMPVAAIDVGGVH